MAPSSWSFDTFKVMKVMWKFIQLKGVGRNILKDYDESIFDHYSDWLFGDIRNCL